VNNGYTEKDIREAARALGTNCGATPSRP
jgi:hypothetical protein